ncbi:SF1B family DNA helicase RecD2 [Anoxynatronum buryatiense]|uniref:ATP-dependent RecD2 DNA helicase n=1 Tax=Anoxynatronum buryatiense TaxID=489973 RepID=A0AA45WVB8_9CLOT|nr:AAA family ATPase [Anoxynatronum buryatiense]SMP52453.1 ATP-dependent DNA helicase, RecD/TraA family [Anoxynatronum buryatiense]
MIQREGKLVETIFHNEANGYRVCLLECDEEMLTVVGVLPGINDGDRLRITGKMTVHPRYGEQLQADTWEPLMPQTLEGIMEYLASGLLPGIGEKMARRLAEAFGMEVFEVMEHHPQRLQEVKGIGARRWPEIAAAFKEHNALRSFLVWMGQRGIDARLSMKIYQAFGEPARDMLQENPYQLLEVLPEIGFVKMDAVARTLGIDTEDPRRVESGLLAVLQASQGEGHTCLPRELLVEQSREFLQTGERVVLEAIQSLALDQVLQVTRLEDGAERIYLMNAYTAETQVAKRLATLAVSAPPPAPRGLTDRLERLQQTQGIRLAAAQLAGIEKVFSHRVLVITGGPGTGKTTLINTLIQLLEEEELGYLLAAPTGRAAKRMTDTSRREAKTLHRLLEVSYSEETREHFFNRDEDNPLETDVVIVDEVSMVDIYMMQHLLKAIGPATTLVMTGDADQLPSVGPGSVLKDMAASGLLPRIHLTEIFRQAQESHIVVNAHRINQGEMPLLNTREKDFFFMASHSPREALATISELLMERLPNYRGFDPQRDIQVLTPTKKGYTGTRQLNEHLQQVMNPPAPHRKEKNHGDKVFREGDRVMQIRNNYSLEWRRVVEDTATGRIKTMGQEEGNRGVFNGDLGRIHQIDSQRELLTILFDDQRLAEYPFALLDELEPAWAITVHKSQGSEFPVVILPLFPAPWVLMTRNLLYTAITRARVLVVLIGSRAVLHRMVENNRIQYRHSCLGSRLAQVALFHETPD